LPGLLRESTREAQAYQVGTSDRASGSFGRTGPEIERRHNATY